METNNKPENGGCPMFSACPMRWMRGHHGPVFIIIKIVIAVLIFWVGVQFGEMKSFFHGNYDGYRDYKMMGIYRDVEMNRLYGPGATCGLTQSSAVPKATSATTTNK